MFSADEAIGLAVALLTSRLGGSDDLPEPVAGALAKIERSLPVELAERIRLIREGFRMAQSPYPLSSVFPQPEVLARLIQAALTHNRCWIRYGSSRDDHTSRDIDPYGVLFVDGRWYVHGWCHLRKATRTFRIDRVRRADVLPEQFQPPEDFDLEMAVLSSLNLSRGGGSFELEVSAPPDAVRWFIPPSTAMVEPIDARTTRVHGTTENPHWLAARIAEMPFPVRVTQLESLREAMRDIAARLTAAAGTAGS